MNENLKVSFYLKITYRYYGFRHSALDAESHNVQQIAGQTRNDG